MNLVRYVIPFLLYQRSPYRFNDLDKRLGVRGVNEEFWKVLELFHQAFEDAIGGFYKSLVEQLLRGFDLFDDHIFDAFLD